MKLFLFVEKKSWLHRADPRTKLLAMLCMFFLALSVQGTSATLFLAVVIVAVGLSAGFGNNLRQLGGLLGMILLVSTLLWGMASGNVPLFWIFTLDGLKNGLVLGIKLVMMITAGLIWLSTTKTEEMAAGMRAMGVPFRIAFAFSTAIRLVPWIVSGCLAVAEAQQSRGLDLHSGNLVVRVRKYVPLLIPALVAVVRNTNQFSMALESRGFGGSAVRSSYLLIRLGRWDAVLAAGVAWTTGISLWLGDGGAREILAQAGIVLALFFGFILILRYSAGRKEGRLLWQNTRMVVLTALSAALYAAVVIPFKGIVFIPGVTDFRPGMALPPVLGVLFGPAAAWGSGFGCVISDFFGSLGPGSLFGFMGNFLMAWIPYRLWFKTGLVDRTDPEPFNINSSKKTANFFLLALLGAIACAFVIGWGLELLGLVPFKVLAVLIAINNSAPILLLSLPVMLVIYPRIRRWGLLWTDIMGDAGVDVSIQRSWFGMAVTLAGIAVGFGGGLYVAFMTGNSPLWVAGAGLLLLFAGGFL